MISHEDARNSATVAALEKMTTMNFLVFHSAASVDADMGLFKPKNKQEIAYKALLGICGTLGGAAKRLLRDGMSHEEKRTFYDLLMRDVGEALQWFILDMPPPGAGEEHGGSSTAPN